MVKLPEGVNINNLIDDLRIFSWEAAEILLKYSQILKKSDYKTNIIKNDDEKDPVTIADLEVNDLMLQRMKLLLSLKKKNLLKSATSLKIHLLKMDPQSKSS